MEAFLVPATAEAQPGALGLVETPLSQTKVITIGRQIGTTLLIDHPSISRRHADIVYANGQYLLRDLSSSNGTFVNGQQLAAMTPHVLQDGDRVGIGAHEFLFRASALMMSPETKTGMRCAFITLEARLLPAPGIPTMTSTVFFGFVDRKDGSRAVDKRGSYSS